MILWIRHRNSQNELKYLWPQCSMGLHDDSEGGAKGLICLPEKQDNQNGYLLIFQTLYAFPKQ